MESNNKGRIARRADGMSGHPNPPLYYMCRVYFSHLQFYLFSLSLFLCLPSPFYFLCYSSLVLILRISFYLVLHGALNILCAAYSFRQFYLFEDFHRILRNNTEKYVFQIKWAKEKKKKWGKKSQLACVCMAACVYRMNGILNQYELCVVI